MYQQPNPYAQYYAQQGAPAYGAAALAAAKAAGAGQYYAVGPPTRVSQTQLFQSQEVVPAGNL